METITPGSNNGAFDGTNEITLVDAPAVDIQRIIKTISVYNRDDQPVTLTISLEDTGGATSIIRIITLQPGDITEICPPLQVLDSVDKTIIGVMSGAANADDPEFEAAYVDVGA